MALLKDSQGLTGLAAEVLLHSTFLSCVVIAHNLFLALSKCTCSLSLSLSLSFSLSLSLSIYIYICISIYLAIQTYECADIKQVLYCMYCTRNVYALLSNVIAHAIDSLRWTHTGTLDCTERLVDIYEVAKGSIDVLDPRLVTNTFIFTDVILLIAFGGRSICMNS